MKTKTKKYINYAYLIIILGIALGVLFSNDFKLSEIPTDKIIIIVSLIVVSLINIYVVKKQEKLEN